MLNRDDLAAAVRVNDEKVDAGVHYPAIMKELGLDPTGTVYVAEQRAIRIALLQSGVTPEELRQAARGEHLIEAHVAPAQRLLIPLYASAWMDGLAGGIRAFDHAYYGQ